MKRYLMLALALLLPLMASAQAKLQTKKYVISDFSEKTTKVLLTGNDMTDAMIRSIMQDIWHVSPYEFCTLGEFEECKKSTDYYFLSISESSFGKNKTAGIMSLNVFKGKDTAGDGFEGLYKVVSVPFCASESSDDRHVAFIAPMLHIIQNEIQKMMKRTLNFSSSIVVTPQIVKGKWNKKVLFDKEDLSFSLGFSMEEIYKAEDIYFVTPEEIAQAISERKRDTVVGYVVAPETPKKNAVSYTMLFDATTYELIYMKNHTITAKTPKGVLQNELRYIISCN